MYGGTSSVCVWAACVSFITDRQTDIFNVLNPSTQRCCRLMKRMMRWTSRWRAPSVRPSGPSMRLTTSPLVGSTSCLLQTNCSLDKNQIRKNKRVCSVTLLTVTLSFRVSYMMVIFLFSVFELVVFSFSATVDVKRNIFDLCTDTKDCYLAVIEVLLIKFSLKLTATQIQMITTQTQTE